MGTKSWGGGGTGLLWKLLCGRGGGGGGRGGGPGPGASENQATLIPAAAGNLTPELLALTQVPRAL